MTIQLGHLYFQSSLCCCADNSEWTTTRLAHESVSAFAQRLRSRFGHMTTTGSRRDHVLRAVSKVPQITALFWVMKIVATTLGETAGDTVTMSMNLGYLTGSLIFAAIFLLAVAVQIAATRFRPWLYWAVIVATTTVGTTLADFADRSLGIGYAGGTLILVAALAASLLVWHRTEGTLAGESAIGVRAQAFYWCTILFSQTLGTALGDWSADALGYLGAAAVFGSTLIVVAVLHFWTQVSRVGLFWAAFVLTRPLGATLGDFLDKPVSHGGLALSRGWASLVLIAILVACLMFLPQRAAVSAEPEPVSA